MPAETNPHGIEVPPDLRVRVERVLRELAREMGDEDPLMCWHQPERGALAILGIDGTLMSIISYWHGLPGGEARFERFLHAMGQIDTDLHIHQEMVDDSLIGFYASTGA